MSLHRPSFTEVRAENGAFTQGAVLYLRKIVRKVRIYNEKLSVLLLAGISCAALLFGCGKKEESPAEETTSAVVQETPESVPVETESETATQEANEEVPPEEGMVRSTLTNEWISGDIADQRPIAVMVPNDSTALPHYSLSRADILYECPVEARITRLMAVFKDWDRDDMDRIGNVRSCVIILYIGPLNGMPFISILAVLFISRLSLSRRAPTTSPVPITAAPGKRRIRQCYYRTSDRKAPQNAYLSAKGANEAMDKLGISKTYREDYYKPDHFKFAPESSPNTLEQYQNSFSASKIDMAKTYTVSKTSFEYNAEDGLYYRFEYGKPHVDARFDNKQLAFKNVLIQFAYQEVRDENGYLSFQVHDTKRDGYYFTNGRGIHVNWKKTADYEPTKFYDDNGNEIELNTGKTMIVL